MVLHNENLNLLRAVKNSINLIHHFHRNEGIKPFLMTPLDAILWPVYMATLMIGFIIAWIGITMATTPPPEPIDLDDLNLDDEDLDEDKDD